MNKDALILIMDEPRGLIRVVATELLDTLDQGA